MLTRIVKLTFKQENCLRFEQIFRETKPHILAFEGCISLQLLQDSKNQGIFFTYSQWESETHLEAYRNSDFFKKVWGKTKPLFDAKAEAWSVIHKG